MVYSPIKCTDFISDSCIKQLDYFTFLTRCQWLSRCYILAAVTLFESLSCFSPLNYS